MSDRMKKPLMRYHGGKWKIAPWICSFFPEHRVYVEPMGGAASVLLSKRPAKVEVYNDINSELFNLFKVLRCPVRSKKLIDLLRLTPYSRREHQACYKKVNNSVEQDRRTLVLSEMSINPAKALKGQQVGFRITSSGDHRMPVHWKNSIDNLYDVIERLMGVILENKDVHTIIQTHDSIETLHYVDPPYLFSERLDKRKIYVHESGDVAFHIALADTLSQVKGMAVVSGYRSDLYDELYTQRGWEPHSIKTTTSSAIKGKCIATEVIWLNPAIVERKHQLQLNFVTA